MKSSILLHVLAAFGLASIASAQAPNYAISPVLHPGTEKRHESFNEISKKGEAQLVFLGDSITHGWESRGKAVWEKYWAPLKAANFGIGGDRTEHVLWRLQNGNYDGLKPKLTVLMIGTNNTGHVNRAQKELNGAVYQCSAEQTAEGVKQIIDTLKKKCPGMKILILGIFPRGVDNNDAMRKQNIATNEIIAKLADNSTVYYNDIGKVFLTPDGVLSKDIMPDLLHPNEKGYEMWANAIEAQVKDLLK
jgi:lysophospholipase L1-like esterase